MSARAYRWTATVLLAVLGLARGGGGVLLLSGGAGTAGAAARPDAPVGWIGGGLIVVGALCLAAGVVSLQGSRAALWLGTAALGAFVVGGLANGTLLYGSPRLAGVAGNLLYALLTWAALWRGRHQG